MNIIFSFIHGALASTDDLDVTRIRAMAQYYDAPPRALASLQIDDTKKRKRKRRSHEREYLNVSTARVVNK